MIDLFAKVVIKILAKEFGSKDLNFKFLFTSLLGLLKAPNSNFSALQPYYEACFLTYIIFLKDLCLCYLVRFK